MSFPPRVVRSMIDMVGSGVGAQLTPRPIPGLTYSGVQWYRNDVAIPEELGGQDVPYVLTAADVPAKGQPANTIVCELTGLTTRTLPVTVGSQ